MKLPQVPPPQTQAKSQKTDTRNIPPEMRKAAEGLEAVFTSEMMKAMRGTVQPSEFSLHNTASDIYQGMLDQEYADVAARQNNLGLSEQIIDYWLREQANPKYNDNRNQASGSVRTGGTHEDKSSE